VRSSRDGRKHDPTTAAMKSLFDTLNIVYGEEEKRGFVKLNAISLLFTVVGIFFVMAALGAIVVIPVALKYMGLSEAADLILRLGRWPTMFVLLTLALAVIYRYGPSREAPRWRWITGAALWPPSCGSGSRRCSPGTRPVSGSSMRPTAPWARSSAS
jgi:virulence factor BrkB